ncbi:MAG: 30S ribosomal protein S12 methylthiotransferase RimO [candidate division Zixibacteria bacterium]|nr:30S ribosomal protein S12 methylthiotransferase RimO [candidate division Zixibacteria bacterium]
MKFFISKLGCPKNDVDGDYIAARLIDEGHTPVATAEEAESVIVNTCGFILPAKEESINEILRMGQLKNEGTVKTVYATGCLTQRYGDDLLEGIPELDGAFGHGALDSIARAVTNSSKLKTTVKIESRKLGYLSWKNRFIADSLPYSYLKISDGCDRTCTYCAIPGMRGKFRSRPLDSIVNEAEFLAKNGKKELILVSQEATLYGYELPGKPTIVTLLEELEKIQGVEWIRLMYQYPAHLTDNLIDYLADENKTLTYYDLPFQHANTDVLKRMNRMIDKQNIERLISRIKSTGNNPALRTTFIVGFPGETDEEFEDLRDFVIEHRFERMGVFTYSAEEGTPAGTMANQIPEAIKKERMEELMSIQHDIAREINLELIGSVQDVIVDYVNGDAIGQGRTKADCPDIDQEVVVKGENLSVGDIRRVRIESLDGYDLIGRVVEA